MQNCEECRNLTRRAKCKGSGTCDRITSSSNGLLYRTGRTWGWGSTTKGLYNTAPDWRCWRIDVFILERVVERCTIGYKFLNCSLEVTWSLGVRLASVILIPHCSTFFLKPAFAMFTHCCIHPVWAIHSDRLNFRCDLKVRSPLHPSRRWMKEIILPVKCSGALGRWIVH